MASSRCCIRTVLVLQNIQNRSFTVNNQYAELQIGCGNTPSRSGCGDPPMCQSLGFLAAVARFLASSSESFEVEVEISRSPGTKRSFDGCDDGHLPSLSRWYSGAPADCTSCV